MHLVGPCSWAEGYSTAYLFGGPLVAIQVISCASQSYLYDPPAVQTAILEGAPEGGAMSDFGPQHGVIDISMSVHVHQAHRAVLVLQTEHFEPLDGWAIVVSE